VLQRLGRAATDAQQRSVVMAITVFTGLAAVAVKGGAYVVDNRFEQYWAPGQRISRSFALWDSTRGLGRVREEMWPGATLPIGVFRLFGASPTVAEHLWHGALLALAGTGMVALLARFRPVIGPEHLLAGLSYQLGPYAATFLVPSNLFFHYALTPWFLVLVHRGMVERDPWRSAAGVALLIGAAGNLDTPGLIYAAVAALSLVLFEVAIERRTSARQAVAWIGRAAALSIAISAAALAKTAIGAASFSQRLESTETPEVIARTSSWSETLRGLGNWVSYFRDGSGPIRAEGALLFTSTPMVMATFAAVLVGVLGLAIARWGRAHLWFGLLAGLGALLMVGAYPPTDPSPYGAVWLWAAHHVPGVGTLRTTYKAGAVMWVGIAALFGTGAVILGDRLRRSTRIRIAPTLLAGACLVAVTAPTWGGSLYNPDRRLTEVPSYWQDAIRWLDDEPGEGQVLILPGATRAVYQWGWPGDDLFDSLLDRPHLVNAAVALSTPMVADVLAAVDQAAAMPDAALAPVLQRLGVEFLLVRNDLDWRRMGIARPAGLSAIRSDPSLELARTFGRPGENVDASDRESAAEDDLPPVEVYRVREPKQSARTVASDAPWLLLEGAGDGWLQLAAAGLLDHDNPVVPTAELDARELQAALEGGARLVLSDSNRRRAQAVTAYTSERSRTLSADEDLGRLLPDLYGREGSQSVAWYRSALSINDPGEQRSIRGFRAAFRPSHAFDGDPRTAWLLPADTDPRDHSLRIDLRRPATVSSLRLVAADARDLDRAADPTASFSRVPRIARATLEFSDGSVEHLNLIAGRADVHFPAHTTSSIEVHVLDVTKPGDVGIAEVSFPGSGLDLRERIQLPDDAFEGAARDDALERTLATAPVTVVLARDVGLGAAPVEAQLRRRVRILGEHRLEVHGTARPEVAITPDCRDIGLRIDGVEVLVRSTGPGRASSPRSFAACSSVTFSTGWHDIEGTGEVIDQLVLQQSAPDGPVERASRPARVTATSPTDRTVDVTASGGGLLVSGEGFDPRWRAHVDGESLGRPIPVDAQTAWRVPESARLVTLQFQPARLYRISQVISVLAVAICLFLVARRRAR